MSPVVAHRDVASRIRVRNAAESGQTRTDANDPSRKSWPAACAGAVADIQSRLLKSVSKQS